MQDLQELKDGLGGGGVYWAMMLERKAPGQGAQGLLSHVEILTFTFLARKPLTCFKKGVDDMTKVMF